MMSKKRWLGCLAVPLVFFGCSAASLIFTIVDHIQHGYAWDLPLEFNATSFGDHGDYYTLNLWDKQLPCYSLAQIMANQDPKTFALASIGQISAVFGNNRFTVFNLINPKTNTRLQTDRVYVLYKPDCYTAYLSRDFYGSS